MHIVIILILQKLEGFVSLGILEGSDGFIVRIWYMNLGSRFGFSIHRPGFTPFLAEQVQILGFLEGSEWV